MSRKDDGARSQPREATWEGPKRAPLTPASLLAAALPTRSPDCEQGQGAGGR